MDTLLSLPGNNLDQRRGVATHSLAPRVEIDDRSCRPQARAIDGDGRSELLSRGASRIRRIDSGGRLEFAPAQRIDDSNSVRFRPDDH